jgi:hypothetical protein
MSTIARKVIVSNPYIPTDTSFPTPGSFRSLRNEMADGGRRLKVDHQVEIDWRDVAEKAICPSGPYGF